MKLNDFSQPFDKTLKYYRITGKALWEKTGISQNHISEFRKGGNISVVALSALMAGMEELAPGSKQYFCSLLAGSSLKPADSGGSPERADWRSLILSAGYDEIEEILHLLADRYAVLQCESRKFTERESRKFTDRDPATLAL